MDKPLYLQYASWIGDVLKGDFGRSFWQDRPIRDTILRRGPITAEIAVIAVALSWIIGLPVGLIAAAWRNHVDRLCGSCGRYILHGCAELLAGPHTNSCYRTHLAVEAAPDHNPSMGRPLGQLDYSDRPRCSNGNQYGGRACPHEPSHSLGSLQRRLCAHRKSERAG